MGKLLILLAFLLGGCELDKYTPAYIDFLDTYGAEDRYYCDTDTGFFMHEYIKPQDDHTTITPVFNNSGDTTECECQT